MAIHKSDLEAAEFSVAPAEVLRQAEAEAGRQVTQAEALIRDRLRSKLSELARAGISVTPELLEVARQRVAGKWRSGVEPMPFDAFCRAAGGISLTPRQWQAFESADLLWASRIVAPDRRVQELVLMWGKGSGKDLIAALFIGYLGYVVLHLRDPCGHFGLAPKTPLHILNVAPNEDLARQVFFAYLRRILQSDVFKPFDPRILADEVRFPSIDLALYSKHSRASGLDGYNLLGWVMDEADDFLDNEKRSNAEVVHNVLRSSANTRLRSRWVGMVLSYPRTKNGFMMRLYDRARGDSTFYADLAATWDVRPDVSREDPGIASDYAHDPTMARARYECQPMEAEETFFEYPERIDSAVDYRHVPVAIVDSSVVVERGLVDGSMGEFIGGQVVSITPEPGRRYFMGCDAGLKEDAFALSIFSIPSNVAGGGGGGRWLCPRCASEASALLVDYGEPCIASELAPIPSEVVCGGCGSSLEEWNSGKSHTLAGWRESRAPEEVTPIEIDGQFVHVPRIREDLLLLWHPHRAMYPEDKNRPVDFLSVQAVCRELIQRLHIVQARFDPWNSASMVHSLQSETGADVREISFSQSEQLKRARLVKALLYSGLITLLPGYPQRVRQWKQLQRLGNRIDHPQHGSKDAYDAEAIAIWLAAMWGNASLNIWFQ